MGSEEGAAELPGELEDQLDVREHCPAARVGPQPPLPHPPAVLRLSHSPYAACLGCTWIAGVLDLDRAAALAREHAAENLGNRPTTLLRSPLRVWRRDGPYDEPGPSWAGQATGTDIDDVAEQARSSDATREHVTEVDSAQPSRPTQWNG